MTPTFTPPAKEVVPVTLGESWEEFANDALPAAAEGGKPSADS